MSASPSQRCVHRGSSVPASSSGGLAEQAVHLLLHSVDFRTKLRFRIRAHREKSPIRPNRALLVAGKRGQPTFFSRDPCCRDGADGVVIVACRQAVSARWSSPNDSHSRATIIGASTLAISCASIASESACSSLCRASGWRRATAIHASISFKHSGSRNELLRAAPIESAVPAFARIIARPHRRCVDDHAVTPTAVNYYRMVPSDTVERGTAQDRVVQCSRPDFRANPSPRRGARDGRANRVKRLRTRCVRDLTTHRDVRSGVAPD